MSDDLTTINNQFSTLDPVFLIHDRGEMYIRVHDLTNSYSSVLEGNISTFSGLAGGTAFAANYILADRSRYGVTDYQDYNMLNVSGSNKIYYMSQQVAQGYIQASLDKSDGNLSISDGVTAASDVWQDNLYGAQFPGNTMETFFAATAVGLSGLINPFYTVIGGLVVANNLTDGDKAAVSGSAASILFGKSLSDYAGRDGYASVNGPDSLGSHGFSIDKYVVKLRDPGNPPTAPTYADGVVVMMNTSDLSANSEAWYTGVNSLLRLFAVAQLQGEATTSSDLRWNQAREWSILKDFRVQLVEGGNNEYDFEKFAQNNGSGLDKDFWGTIESKLLDSFGLVRNALYYYDRTINGTSADDYIVGGSGNDNLSGGNGIDVIRAGWNNDILLGGAGADRLYGESGDDILDGGSQNDIINGGEGDDTVTYIGAVSAVDVDLQIFTGTDGQGGTDTLFDIENVTGTAASDYLKGDRHGNIIRGNGGIDTINGREGRDTAYAYGGNGAVLLKAAGSMMSDVYLERGISGNPVGGSYTKAYTDTLTSIEKFVLTSNNDFATFSNPTISSDPLLAGDEIDGGDGTDTYFGTGTYDLRTHNLTGVDRVVGGITLKSFETIILQSGASLIADETRDFVLPTTLTGGLSTAGSFQSIDYSIATHAAEFHISSLNLTAAAEYVAINGKTHTYSTSGGPLFEAAAYIGTNYGDVAYLSKPANSYATDPNSTTNTFVMGRGNDVINVSGNGGQRLIYTGGNDIVYGANAVLSLTINGPVVAADVSRQIMGTGVYKINIAGIGSITLDYTSSSASGGTLQEVTFGTQSINVSTGVISGTPASSLSALGYSGNDIIYDHAGSYVSGLYGGAGNDTLYGLAGNDVLFGGYGSDTYMFSLGDGQDSIQEDGDGGQDTIRLGSGILASAVSFNQIEGVGFVIKYSANDSIALNSQYDNDFGFSWKNGVEKLILADGTEFDLTDRITWSGTSGSDYQWGTAGDDIFATSSGANSFEDVEGDDTYIFALGTGADYVSDRSGNDKIKVAAGISLLNLAFSGSGSDIVISAGTSDSFNIGQQYYPSAPGAAYMIESVVMANGRVIDLTGNMPRSGTTGNDTLSGNTNDDLYIYRGGLDSISDTGGVDTILIATQTIFENLAFATSGTTGLKITISAGSSEITISNQLGTNDGLKIESLEMNDLFALDLSRYSTWLWAPGGAFNGDNGNVVGTDLEDTIIGSAGVDTIHGYDLDDTIHGRAGNDVIFGDSGDDLLHGGTGNDSINGGAGSDSLWGGSGDDDLIYEGGLDTVRENATEGTDRLVIGSTFSVDQAVFELGADGAYKIVFSPDTDEISIPFAQIETIQFSDGFSASLNWQSWLFASAAGGTLSGTSTDNVIVGRSGQDTIYAGSGNDTVAGGSGNDTIYGEDGNDWLSGGNGSDTIYGGLGDDVYSYESGHGYDLLGDTGGADQIRIGSGFVSSDLTTRASGNDLILTLKGIDVMTIQSHYAGSAIEQVKFFDGTIINLPVGGSYIYGTSSNDTLTGTSGNDTIDGLAGADTMSGLQGNDTYIVDNVSDVVTESSGQGTDIILSSVTYTMAVNVENITLTGSSNINATGTSSANTMTGNAFNNGLNGGGGNDLLLGLDGNDTLDGSTGDDRMEGGLGNDRYTYTSGSGKGNDVVLDTGGTADNILFGSTYIASNVSLVRYGQYDLAFIYGGQNLMYVENQFTANGAIESVKWGDASTLTLSTVQYTTTGTSGADTLYGIGFGGNPDDIINGLAGNDTIYGYEGNDTIDGGADIDALYGGAGNDVYKISSASGLDTITDTSGIDKILFDAGYVSTNMVLAKSGNNLNVVMSGTTVATVVGHFDYAVDQMLETIEFSNGTIIDVTSTVFTQNGTSGVDTLQGHNGRDSLVAGDGNDILYGYGGIDTLTGGNGTDTLYGGSGNDLLYGNNDNDTIWGDSGDDTLDGGGGTDTMYGGAGNDIYIANSVTDVITENAGEGIDTIQTGSSRTLGADVENITFISTGNANGTGNALDNVITGNIGLNTLRGGDGNDTLTGGAGNDTLYGENDIDLLIADAGIDTMYGGAGADTFKFSTATLDANSDFIKDYSAAQSDVINVKDLLIGYDPVTKVITDYIEMTTSGSNTIMKVDQDGLGTTHTWTQIAQIDAVTGMTDEAALVTQGRLIVS